MVEASGTWISDWHRRFGRPLFHVCIALLFAIQLAVCWGMAQGFRDIRTVPDTLRLARVMEWIRSNTPQTTGYLNPVHRPEYGILVPQWHYGHHLLFLAHRPEVATPIGGTPLFIGRIRTALSAMAATDEEQLGRICERDHVRYLLVRGLTEPSFSSYMAAAAALQQGQEAHALPTQWNQSFMSQLTDHAATVQELLQQFHLVYEEPTLKDIPDARRWRLYEYTGRFLQKETDHQKPDIYD